MPYRRQQKSPEQARSGSSELQEYRCVLVRDFGGLNVRCLGL